MIPPLQCGQTRKSEYRLVLLGAGRPWRGHLPSAIQTVSETRVLDWLLKAFYGMPTHFIGGYQFAEVTQRYPELTSTLNIDWKNTGSAMSLLLAPRDNRPSVVSYTDIVIRPQVADELLASDGDVVLAVDGKWRERIDRKKTESSIELLNIKEDRVTLSQKTGEQVEFAGIMRLSVKAMETIDKNRDWLKKNYQRKHLASLGEWFLLQKLDVKIVDISGDWAELNTPQDLAEFLLGTKFETLNRLSGMLKYSHVCDHIGFSLKQWHSSYDKILEKTTQHFAGKNVIVRSSTLGEDSWSHSLAGKYTSIADINPQDHVALNKAIKDVIASYADTNPLNQVLIESYLFPVKMSGVVFTRNLKYRAPYYVINYDDQGQRTDGVTSGTSKSAQKLFILLRDHEPPDNCKRELRRLWRAVKEVEEVIGHDSLDIEFAMTPDDKIYILQVRPLTAIEERWCGSYQDVQTQISKARVDYRKCVNQPSSLHGGSLIYGMMPDWNPAEIIGTRPTRLAESLYRHLVTDDIWSQQRAEYGYTDVRGHKLMRCFAGHAYIDVRASFNSFLPDELDDELKAKLANYYLEQLEQNPHLHDKIEFDIAITCLTLDFNQRSQRLLDNGFTLEEVAALRSALMGINSNALLRYRQDMATANNLLISKMPVLNQDATLGQAFYLLDHCKIKGVLPFAHLARSAFIAMALLKSAVTEDIFSQEVMNQFLASLHNITGQLQQDAKQVAEGRVSWNTFVDRYAHLRPGSYNIASPSYGDDPEYYLRPIVKNSSSYSKKYNGTHFPWQEFALKCDHMGFKVSPKELEDFIRTSIGGREKAKFIFMRYVDAALKIFKQYGRDKGLCPKELAHLDISDLRSLASGHHGVNTEKFLRETMTRNQLEHEICLGIELPKLLTSGQDFYAFYHVENTANFIGAKAISAKVIVLQEGVLGCKEEDLENKIVAIMQGDPGWDWIFGYNIAGLITAWGGANSHMAIRAAELDLTAVIGLGETEWQRYSKANELYINCATREIKAMI